MEIGIFAPSDNNQALKLYEDIKAVDLCTCTMFDLHCENVELLVNDTGVYWNNINLEKLDLVYMSGFLFMNPVVPAATDHLDWTVWQADYLADQQKYSFLFSLFEELARRGVQIVNSAQGFLQGFMKAHLLENIRRAGFLVPRFICSNDLDQVNSFIAENKVNLWRPTAGRAAWQLFLDRQKRHLVKNESPPVLIAEAVTGPLIRGYFYKQDNLLMLKFNSPQYAPLEKLEKFMVYENDHIVQELSSLLSVCGIEWGLVYFIIKDDRPWVYDIDADPLFTALPEEYAKYLSMRLAYSLSGKECDVSHLSGLKETCDRPALFLRRMMQVLFEFEQSKYVR